MQRAMWSKNWISASRFTEWPDNSLRRPANNTYREAMYRANINKDLGGA
jgi:hypothetical protein